MKLGLIAEDDFVRNISNHLLLFHKSFNELSLLCVICKHEDANLFEMINFWPSHQIDDSQLFITLELLQCFKLKVLLKNSQTD